MRSRPAPRTRSCASTQVCPPSSLARSTEYKVTESVCRSPAARIRVPIEAATESSKKTAQGSSSEQLSPAACMSSSVHWNGSNIGLPLFSSTGMAGSDVPPTGESWPQTDNPAKNTNKQAACDSHIKWTRNIALLSSSKELPKNGLDRCAY